MKMQGTLFALICLKSDQKWFRGKLRDVDDKRPTNANVKDFSIKLLYCTIYNEK